MKCFISIFFIFILTVAHAQVRTGGGADYHKEGIIYTEGAVVQPNLVIDGNKEQMLTSLLENSEAPVAKAHIYEALWGEPLLDKEELRKLTRLVSRIRSEHGLNIETRKGTYSLVREKKSKAS